MPRITPLRASSSSSSSMIVRLECSPTIYRMIWVLLLCLHLMIGVSFCIVAILYFITIYRESRILLQFVAIEIELEISWTICILATFVCLWHFYCAFQMIFFSLKSRRLCFVRQEKTVKPKSERSNLDWFRRQMYKWTSVQGDFFDVIFNIREVIEICIQSIQLYRMTTFVSRRWICSLNVAIIFLNCWSTPLIMYFLSSQVKTKALSRFLCILLDTILDFSSCIFIPFMVLLPYYQQKDSVTSMQLDALYEATFMVNLAVELKLILSNSWIALLSLLIPAMSMSFCMENMKLLIHLDTNTSTSTTPVSIFVHPKTLEKEVGGVRPCDQTKGKTNQRPQKMMRLLSSHAQTFQDRFSRRAKVYFSLLHMFFLTLGAGILVIHGIAINKPMMHGCQESVYPWFEPRISCSVLYINCAQRHIKGKSHELESIFENSSEQSLAALVFMHCPALEMPPKMSTFSQLFWIEIYNSTLVEWSKEAALRAHLHPYMTSLYMVHVNFTDQFPSGLLVDDIASNLVDFQVSDSNLRTLPENLHSKWPSEMLHLIIEWSELTEVPSTLMSMKSVLISLVGNQIQTIPTSLLAQQPDKLFLSYNPINNFTNDSIDLSDEQIQTELHVEYTNLTAVPHWLEDAIEKNLVKVFAYATPLCNTNSSTTTTFKQEQPTRPLEICLQPQDPTKIQQFPLQTYIASKSRGETST